ncbi:hypothetical protein RhiJN_09173 [Ceratobasidium sp. AG-Ba]|nr:hypothetical protein RhiJN_09173 [Ceratobasidium sp. AG-Ba]
MIRVWRCVAARRFHTSVTCGKQVKKVEYPDQPRPKYIPTAKEQELITKRRILKAERDERISISTALTEVKTYMGGFTRPRELRVSNWFPGGEYIRKGKVYEQPVPEAYTPHTVFILESRYRIRTKEPGRPDVYEHIVSMCRADQFTAFVKGRNSPNIGGETRVSMDAAWWPSLGIRAKKEESEPWWDEGEDPKQIRLEALGVTENWEQTTPEVLREYLPNPTQYRNNGTKIVEPTPTKTLHPHRKNKTIGEIRAMYEPTLEHEPFWRPLISVTVATRPLGATILRLCKSLPRGLPFYASIQPDDRKTYLSFPARMRLMRLQRIRELTIELARRLEGYYGGIVGIRFNHEDRGRGVRGERLAEPLPDELRIIQVGLANWYRYERERELWELEAKDAGVDIGLMPMDEWGRKLDSTGEIMAGQEAVDGAAIWEPEDMEDEENENDEIK